MTDIVLAGVNIAELKKQKQAIQKDAVKFLSDGVEKVKALVAEITTLDTDSDHDTINAKALEAVEILEDIQVVSGVSGVEYYLPHRDEYGYSSGDGEPMLALLENAELEGDDVDSLMGLLEDMEYEVRKWNTSTC